MTTVVLQYFDSCPNWIQAEALLLEALAITGNVGVILELQRVETNADALRMGFIGSPSILINGLDPFAVGDAQPGLSCRLYQTPKGLRGSPTLEQILTELRRQ
ncbi:MAG: thioredoxin family protein [Candidatus Nanopelagicales bacterium]|nr:thioredoxin family protein [Candidatus Nanopelagicales bacterium]